MRDVSFFVTLDHENSNSLKESFDLEKELVRRGFPIATHGRIDWDKLPKKTIMLVNDDHEAEDAIVKLIHDYKLAGLVTVVWADAGINPLVMGINSVPAYVKQICEEDWDCWIISNSGNWLIEKYHEGEVCYTDSGVL